MDAAELGLAYAFAGNLTDQIKDEIRNNNSNQQIVVIQQQEESIPFVDASKDKTSYVEDWDSFVGQKKAKRQLEVHIQAAKNSNRALPHVLLASGMPGVGKTTIARLIAKRFGTRIQMLVPPFTADTLTDAAFSCGEQEFLFIDEIHKLADHGPRAAENLLHILEEGRIYSEGTFYHLENFTVIGATTDADKLPETVIDRFSIKPTFEKYSLSEMVDITHNFAKFYDTPVLSLTKHAIACASRRTPRIAREMVVASRDMYEATGLSPWPHELLEFLDVEPNGMGAEHRNYLLLLYKQYRRVNSDGSVEYVASEATIKSALRLPTQGLNRLERFLIELGFIGRSPRGRFLTEAGVREAASLSERY